MKKYLISLLLVSPFFVFAQTFDRDLFFGIQKDSDVTKVQEFLTEQGVYSGPISGNFFSLTLQGVKTFQIKQGISPTSGYFGPKSRVKANLILAAQGVSSTGVADESGSPTPAAITPPKTTNDTVSALMVQIQLLQQQLNALQKQQNTNPVPTPPPIVTLPSPNQVSPTILQISSVAVSTGLPSARIEWKTNIPSDSKLFLTDPDGTPHIYSSLSGFSTQHFVNMTLAAGLTFSYEIEAIAQGSVAKYVGKFTMGNHMPTKLWWDSTSNPQFWGLYCSRTHILAKIIDENGDEMNGQPG